MMPGGDAKDSLICGFVGVVGFANVGKSTLVNSLVGRKVSIVSDKPQTTRNRIRGILNTPDTQIVFIDTPGIQRPRDRLEEHMVRGARGVLRDVDAILFIVDGSRERPGKGDVSCARFITEVTAPAIMVVNKMDLVHVEKRDERLEAYASLGEYRAVLAVSALHGHNLELLMDELLQLLPRGGPRFFPADMTTDQPVSFVVAELIREKVLQLTEQEVPYATAVQIRDAQERDDGTFYLAADILVERASQKGILIGRGGRMIKAIGQRSREEVETALGVRVFLDLHVRVQKKWRESQAVLRELGLAPERE